MLPKKITDLLQEVFEYFGEESKEAARNNPEGSLVSLLQEIKKDLPDVSSTLKMTIEWSTFDPIEEQRKLDQGKKKKVSKKVVVKSR